MIYSWISLDLWIRSAVPPGPWWTSWSEEWPVSREQKPLEDAGNGFIIWIWDAGNGPRCGFVKKTLCRFSWLTSVMIDI